MIAFFNKVAPLIEGYRRELIDLDTKCSDATK